MVDELPMEPPLTTRPPALKERWDAVAAEMRAVFAFENGDENENGGSGRGRVAAISAWGGSVDRRRVRL
jgi:hypothetical protein